MKADAEGEVEVLLLTIKQPTGIEVTWKPKEVLREVSWGPNEFMWGPNESSRMPNVVTWGPKKVYRVFNIKSLILKPCFF